MAGLADAAGGGHLELRLPAVAGRVRLLLALQRWEEAAEAAAAHFNTCMKAGYQVWLEVCSWRLKEHS